MTRWMAHLVIATALLMLPGQLSALTKAEDWQIQIIRAQIRRGTLMNKAIVAARDEASEAERKKLDPTEIARRRAKADRLERAQLDAYTKGLHMIAFYYDIDQSKGTSVMRPTRGRQIELTLRARYPEARDIRDAKGNERHVPKSNKPHFGRAYTDGVVYIDPETIARRDVAWIAAVVFHEAVHVRQYMTNGDKMTRAERQQAAFQAGLDNKQFFFDLNVDPRKDPVEERKRIASEKKHIATIEGFRDEFKAAHDAELNESLASRLWRRIRHPNEDDGDEHSPLSDKEFQAARQDAIRFRNEVRNGEEARRAEASLGRLREAATRACAGRGLNQANFDSMWYADRAFYLRAEANFWTNHRGARTCADFLYASFLTHLATHDKLDARLLAEFQRGHLDGFRNFARKACAGERLRTHDYDAIWYFEDRKLYARESDRIVREATGRLNCEEDKFTSDLGWLAAGRLPPEAAYAEPPYSGPKIEAPDVSKIPRAHAEPVRVPASADADLETMAKAACADPAGLERRKLPDLHWFPYPDDNLGKRSRARWTECEGRVYDHLLGMNAGWKSLDLDEVRRVARPPAPPAPGGAFAAPRADNPRGGGCARNPDTGIVGCPQN